MIDIIRIPYLQRKATPWVSQFVLVGCLLITLGIMFVSKDAEQIASGWSITELDF